MKKVIAGGGCCWPWARSAAEPRTAMAMTDRAIVRFIVVLPSSLSQVVPAVPVKHTASYDGRSEIRLVRDRHVIVKQVLVVFGADELGQRPSPALIALVGLPRAVERV